MTDYSDLVFSWKGLPCPYDTGYPECIRHKCHREGGCDTWCPFRYDIDGNRPKEVKEKPLRIGLYNLEPKIVNTAMMQVSQYHKQRGDTVEPYLHFDHDGYDHIYAFSIFQFTSKKMVTKDMICGGTGFDIKSKLPPEIEACDYDWSIYPDCDYSIVWFSRGCIRACPFCVVRQKEGKIYSIKPKNLNPKGKFIKVMDNNFFANTEWRAAVEQLKSWNQPVDFQGVDVRLLDREQCEALNSLKHMHQIHIAWDDPHIDLEPKLREVSKYIKPYKLMVYVLVGFNSTEADDLHRIKVVKELKMDPFVMPFNKNNHYQMDLARWCNNKIIFNVTDWEGYKRQKHVKAVA